MSDLISRKALANELQKYFVNNTIHKNDLAEVLATQPTAFDVEAVVKELEKMKLVRVEQCHEDYEIEVMTASNFDDAIKIVRKGGVK